MKTPQQRTRLASPWRLLAALLLLPLAAVADEPLVLSTPEDVRDLLRDAQAALLPSASVVTQDVGAVSVAPATTNAAAWFAAVGDPLPVLLWGIDLSGKIWKGEVRCGKIVSHGWQVANIAEYCPNCK